MHWASSYIGIPFDRQGEGPDSFHCWSFVRFVQKAQFNIEMAHIPSQDAVLTSVKLFQAHPELDRWEQVSDPVEGDCVLIGGGRFAFLIGIWCQPDGNGGGVLHCAQGSGVVFQSKTDLQTSGWHINGFYRFKQWACRLA